MSEAQEWSEPTGEIAIIGMAGRFPMARDVAELWRHLRAGKDCIQRFGDEELLAEGLPAELLADPNYVKAWGWMEGVDEFDAAFFNTSAREAELTDPQIRLLLECAWETLEDAGIDPDRFRGRIGSFCGSAMMHYLWQNLLPTPGLVESVGFTQAWIVNDRDFVATRLNYKLNLRGPGMTVQSACSTSLVSVHLAVQSLLAGESDVALAGGVCAPLKDKRGYLYTEGGTLSPDGKVRSFDRDAQGMLGGNGMGLLALKRLEDAQRDGDRIRAVIKASALNNDGSDKVTYTAPSVAGQVQVISDALDLSGVDPESISYVEAHGTGTPLGDPIEIAALTQAWGARTAKTGWCPIGSIKSNLGHLDTAAGVAGLIKSVLQLEHRELVPSLNFEQPNPAIDFAASPFYVNTELRAWDTEHLPRRSTVSSLGMGGTNAHVILEEAPEVAPAAAARAHSLTLVSARSPAALEAGSLRLGAHLAQGDQELADVAYTTQLGRKAFERRRFVVARQASEAASAWNAFAPGAHSGEGDASGAPSAGRSVAFLFSGQGSQHVHMGRGLHGVEPVFTAAFDRCAALLKPLIGADLAELILAEEASAETLSQTQFTQPALFAIEYALAEQWQAWGVEPAAMLGHSIGEFVAACLAGVMRLEDALKLVAERGRLMGGLPAGGGMLAVHADEASLRAQLTSELSIAAFNAEQLTVVSGPLAALDALAASLEAAGVACRQLQTSHAFHSSLMDPIVAAFQAVVASVELQAPQKPLISCATGQELSAAEATDPAYWARHLREPVRFLQAAAELRAAGHLLLEVGPGQALTMLLQLQAASQPDPAARSLPAVASMRHPKQAGDDQAQLLAALGSLWTQGARIDWERFGSQEKRRKVSLPSYAFQRRRFWIERPAEGSAARAPEQKCEDLTDWFHAPSWKLLAPATREARTAQRWCVFEDGSALCGELIERLWAAGAEVQSIRVGSSYGLDGGGRLLDPQASEDFERLVAEWDAQQTWPEEIVYAWGRGHLEGAPLQLEFHALMLLLQSMAARAAGSQTLRLSVLSEGMYSVLGEAALRPAARTSLGLCMSANLELSGVSARAIDLDGGPAALELLWAELHAPLEHPLVALQSGRRWAETFVPTPLPATEADFGTLKAGGVVLITGGLGGIGLTLAGELARRSKAKLVLLSRSGLPSDGNSPKLQAVRALESVGAEVLVLAADVTDEASLAAALEATLERFGCLDAVIHAAGVAGSGLLELKTREQVERVLAAKVEGTRLLRKLLHGRSLDFVLLCSSISSVCIGIGQADYFAANAYLDAEAQAWRTAEGTPVCAINWDAWSEVGMAVETQIPAELQAERAASLKLGIPSQEAIEACRRILASDLVQVVVSPRPLTERSDYRMRYDLAFARRASLAAATAESAPSETSTSSARASSPRPELPNPFVAPAGETQERLARIWSDLLGLDRVGLGDNFFALGGNSLIMMQVGVRLRDQFGISLPIRELFELITLEQLATAIEGVRGVLQAAPEETDEDEETEEFTF